LKEEDRESGGYFIVNGNEKLIRLLIAPKRHIPLLLERSSLLKCGPMYTRFGIFMRSVRDDGTGASFQLLYLTDGSVVVRTWIQRRGFFLPLAVLMRACSPLATDEELFARVRGDADDSDTFVMERLAALLSQGRDKGLHDHESCLLLLGQEFRKSSMNLVFFCFLCFLFFKSNLRSSVLAVYESVSARSRTVFSGELYSGAHQGRSRAHADACPHDTQVVCVGARPSASREPRRAQHARDLDLRTDLWNGVQRKALELADFLCQAGGFLFFILYVLL
jgi:hypothetical protein